MKPAVHASKMSRTVAMVLCFMGPLLFGVTGCSVSEWIEVNCPEEHFATRLPRDPASTYRHYGSRYESGYRASEAALRSLIAGPSPSDTLTMIAVDFTRYLTGERSAVQMQLQKTVARLQENPCDDEAHKRFQYLIEYVNFNGNYLHKIAVACRDTSSNLRMMLEEYRREKN
jgi:hypothetical protein